MDLSEAEQRSYMYEALASISSNTQKNAKIKEK